MRQVGVALATVALMGCGTAATSRVDVVARAAGYELGVEPLAELLAQGKGLPLQREVAEGIAVLWVDFTLFADRLLRGESLLAPELVARAMWADIQQEIASRYHERLIGAGVGLDSAQLDSAYAAGDLRLIKHVLFSVRPDATPDDRRLKQRLAEDVHRKLLTGQLTWSDAAGATDEPGGAERDGSLGVIAHGETVAQFENRAWALAPGEISDVTETSYGYHILLRPNLSDVREEFAGGVERKLEESFDDAYLADLPSRWDLEVKRGIGPAVREMGRDPLRAKESGKVLGTFKGGRFRVSDLARWLQAMPPEVRQQVGMASDSQVTLLVRSLLRNEVLLREARAAGVTASPEFMVRMTDDLRRELALMGVLLGLRSDSLAALRALPVEARRNVVSTRVLGYLQDLSQNRKRLQTVPPFLADALRDDAKWAVVPAGIEQVLTRARQLRLTLPPQAPEAAPPPGGLPLPPGDASPGAQPPGTRAN